jgi:hypothetical protein
MQQEVLAILAEAHDYDSYLEKLEIVRGVFRKRQQREWTCKTGRMPSLIPVRFYLQGLAG